MDKVLIWFDGKYYYNMCVVCGELYPVYKVENHIIYNLKKKCKCGEREGNTSLFFLLSQNICNKFR